MKYILAILMMFASCGVFAQAMTEGETDAASIASCMDKGKDGESQRTCVLAVALMKAIGAKGTANAQPQVIVQQQAQRHWLVDALGSFFGPLKDTVIALAPAAAQIVTAKQNSATQRAMAEYQRDSNIALYGAFTNANGQAVNAVRDTAGMGFTSVSDIARNGQPLNTYNINNSNGVNTGYGAVTYNPITSSYNPVNPNPTVVTCVGTPPVCSSPTK